MSIKTTKYHFTPTKTAKIRRQQVLVRMWGDWSPHLLLVELKDGVTTLETGSGGFSKN